MEKKEGRSLRDALRQIDELRSQFAVSNDGWQSVGSALNHNTDVMAGALTRFETILNVMRLTNQMILDGRRDEVVLTLDGQINFDHYAMYQEACIGIINFVDGLKRFCGETHALVEAPGDTIIFGGT